MKIVCEVCGNEISGTTLKCKYCGAKQHNEANFSKNGVSHRIINIELGMPAIEEALAKCKREIDRAKLDKVAVLTIIHGYGSSGRGGAIRTECRKALEYLVSIHDIRGFIPGEKFTKRQGRTRALLRRIPQLEMNDNLNRNNKGVTIVEL